MKASGPRDKQTYAKLPAHIKEVASRPGVVVCLKCRKSFESPDKSRVRMCRKCSEDNTKEWCARSLPSEEGTLD